MADYTDLLYAPVYAALGVTIDFALTNEQLFSLVGLDKSGGIEVKETGIDVPTIRPAAVVRMADLVSLSVSPMSLLDGIIDLNGTSWRIISYVPKPSPRGENDGELYLILVEAS